MRLSIPAAFLAAVLVWPAGAGAQMLEDNEVVRCAAVTLAYTISRVVEEHNIDLLERGFVTVNRAIYTRHIQRNGYFPAFDVRESILDDIKRELSPFMTRYDETRESWSRTEFREILGCYEKMSSYLLSEGSEVIIGVDRQKLDKISSNHAEDLIKYIKNRT